LAEKQVLVARVTITDAPAGCAASCAGLPVGNSQSAPRAMQTAAVPVLVEADKVIPQP
jgi:hypothetical protein